MLTRFASTRLTMFHGICLHLTIISSMGSTGGAGAYQQVAHLANFNAHSSSFEAMMTIAFVAKVNYDSQKVPWSIV
jgi:hypothetical protein